MFVSFQLYCSREKEIRYFLQQGERIPQHTKVRGIELEDSPARQDSEGPPLVWWSRNSDSTGGYRSYIRATLHLTHLEPSPTRFARHRIGLSLVCSQKGLLAGCPSTQLTPTDSDRSSSPPQPVAEPTRARRSCHSTGTGMLAPHGLHFTGFHPEQMETAFSRVLTL